MGGPRSRRARRRIALALCVTWIVGFELLPWLHVVLHDHLAPHHHDASGAVVLGEEPHQDHQRHDHHVDVDLDAEVDEHTPHDADDLDAEVDEHGAPVAHEHDDHDDHDDAIADGRAHLLRALSHGAHSLAHHGIAVPVPAPVITEPLPIDRRPFTLAANVACTPIGRVAATPSARGPPAELI